MSLEQEIRRIDCEIDKLRNFQKTLSSPKFRTIYAKLADTSEVDAIIREQSLEKLHVWIRINLPFEDRTVLELRKIAQGLNVVNWNNLPKDELICRIHKKLSKDSTVK